MEPEKEEDAAVSPAPDTLGQVAAFRDEAANARANPP